MDKSKKKKKEEEKTRWHDGLKEETKHSILGLLCVAVSLFLLLAIFGKAGLLGEYVYDSIKLLFGKTLFLLPLLCFFVAVTFFVSFRPHLFATNLIGGFLVFLSGLSLAEIIFGEKTGGYIGFGLAFPFLKLIDYWASLILFLVLFLAGVLIMFNIYLNFSIFRKTPKKEESPEGENSPEEGEVSEPQNGKILESLDDIDEGDEPEDFEEPEEIQEDGEPEKKSEEGDFEDGHAKNRFKKLFGKKFEAPPLDLLEGDKGKPSAGDIKANANIIKRTLQNFGITVEMDEVRIGPAVTQYSFKPAEGIKLARITALGNDLSLALAAHPIRIEAPIPGKSLVGIEVPNRTASLVGLRHLVSEPEFCDSEKPLLLALGRNVAGKPVYGPISKMPHLLIAGATGSGKSVAIHSLIMSLLYRHSPIDLQLLMIDPKRVELNVYNSLPYLLSPVIIDAKKAIMALKWATKEMERRYDILLGAGARDINSFHKKKQGENMPYIVIIIDELADIMATYPREFESSIVRLAQMSRAVGIHLVVSTQRPSVEVITGLIKANITARIAFQVASQVDSRTILDMGGAEKLLGNGDMLFLSGDAAKPRRIQGSFVSEKEVKRVVDYLTNYYEDLDLEEVNLSVNGEMQQSVMFEDNPDGDDDVDDDLYEEAREIIIKAGKASSSYLQRRLRIGYARAARLLDILEEKGVVGPPDGSKPRDVLIKGEEEY